MTAETILYGVCAGIAATATMDVLAIAFGKLGLIAGAKGEWVGRWYLGMPRGRFAYKDITAAPELAGERQAAVVGHYAIGIALALFYVIGAGWAGFSPGSFLAAVGYGLSTTVFSWFLVMPCLGFGLFGMAGPRGLKLFRSSLANHLSYGFGLWWISVVLSL